MEQARVRLRRTWWIGVLACWLGSCASASRAGDTLNLVGTLVSGGVECQLFQADGGGKYTLVGDLDGFENGDRVRISGEVVDVSFCMQETTLAVETIRALEP